MFHEASKARIGEGKIGAVSVFLGQLRDRLITILRDNHERFVPDVLEWELTECDLNKDIKVSDLFHFTGLKIQVKHMDHLFCLYVKSIGKDTLYRVEERKHPHKPALDFINEVFNPLEKKLKWADTAGITRADVVNTIRWFL